MAERRDGTRRAGHLGLSQFLVGDWRARAVMVPPNSSRAGRCGTFLGAGARRRRLPHAFGKSSPAAAVKPRDRPRQKLLVLHRHSLHYSHSTVRPWGKEQVLNGNEPPRRAQSARFPMDHRWLLPLGVVETQEFLPQA